MLTTDFEYAKQFMSDIHEHNRLVIMRFYSEYAELNSDTAVAFYEAQSVLDQARADHEYYVLERLATKMGIELIVPETLAERRRLMATQYAERQERRRAANEESRRAAKAVKTFANWMGIMVGVVIVGSIS